MRQKKKNGFRIMQEGDAQKGDVQKGDAQKGQTSAGGPPVDSDIAELDMQVKDYRKSEYFCLMQRIEIINKNLYLCELWK